MSLLDQLRAFWRARRVEVDEQFNRTLPFGDYIVDRWEKARLLGFGEGTSIYDSALVLGDVTVGKNTWIGPGAILDGSGGALEIGDTCSIGGGVQITTHESIDWALSGGVAPFEKASTKIGSRCFIGGNTIVRMGVTIGDGCFVAPLSFVNKDLAPGSRVAGSPARALPAVRKFEDLRRESGPTTFENCRFFTIKDGRAIEGSPA